MIGRVALDVPSCRCCAVGTIRKEANADLEQQGNRSRNNSASEEALATTRSAKSSIEVTTNT